MRVRLWVMASSRHRLVEEEPELNLTWDPIDEDDEEEEEDNEDEERNEWNKLLAGGEN